MLFDPLTTHYWWKRPGSQPACWPGQSNRACYLLPKSSGLSPSPRHLQQHQHNLSLLSAACQNPLPPLPHLHNFTLEWLLTAPIETVSKFISHGKRSLMGLQYFLLVWLKNFCSKASPVEEQNIQTFSKLSVQFLFVLFMLDFYFNWSALPTFIVLLRTV